MAKRTKEKAFLQGLKDRRTASKMASEAGRKGFMSISAFKKANKGKKERLRVLRARLKDWKAKHPQEMEKLASTKGKTGAKFHLYTDKTGTRFAVFKGKIVSAKVVAARRASGLRLAHSSKGRAAARKVQREDAARAKRDALGASN